MKRLMAAITTLVISSSCLAAGWSDLSGNNLKGDLIYIFPAWDSEYPPSRDYSIKENQEFYFIYVYKGGKTSKKKPIIYKDQRCKLKTNSAGEPTQFSCEKDGKSPLSGAAYKITPNKNPDDCSFESKYVCINGCGNDDAPQNMMKSYWECGI